MANVFIDEAVMAALASLLREFTESETKYLPADMPPAFRVLLEAGGGGTSDGGEAEAPVLIPLEVAQNGVFVPAEGVDGYSMVTVNVPSSGSLENGIVVTSVDEAGNWLEAVVYGEVPPYCFAGQTYLQSVTIVNATSIGNYAFQNCSALTNVVIPDSVTSIGTYAFYNCTSLTSIDIPDGVTVLGTHVFYGCSGLTSVGGVGSGASVEIPAGVTSIGNNAFYNCSGIADFDIPDNITSIGNYALCGCTNLSDISIPNTVTNIGTRAFQNCTSLVAIDLPDGLTSLGDGVFYGCVGLTSIEIPVGVTTIGNYAFRGCTALTSIVIPDAVTTIGAYSLAYCSALEYVQIGVSDACAIATITTTAFNSCNALTDIFVYKHTDEVTGSPWGATSATVSWVATRQIVYSWDFTQSLVDTVSGQQAVLSTIGTSVAVPTQNENGLVFNAALQYCDLGAISLAGKSLEIDVAEFDFQGNTSAHIRFVMGKTGNGSGPLIWRYNSNPGWAVYSGSWSAPYGSAVKGTSTDIINYFNGKTIKLKFDGDCYPTLYVDDVLIGTSSVSMQSYDGQIYIGASPVSGGTQAQGNQCYNMTISGIRIYKE